MLRHQNIYATNMPSSASGKLYSRGSGKTTRALGTWAVRNAEEGRPETSDIDGILSYWAISDVVTFIAGDMGTRPNFYMDARWRLVDRGAGRHGDRPHRGRNVQDVVIFRAMNGFSQVRIGGTGARRRAGQRRYAAHPRLRLAVRRPAVQPPPSCATLRLRHAARAGRRGESVHPSTPRTIPRRSTSSAYRL